MELNQIRQQIDQIDTKIAELFLQRMQCTAAVAQYKHEKGMRIRDEERNNQIKSHASDIVGEDLAPYVRRLYDEILNISRDYQREVMIQVDIETLPPEEHHSI